MADIELVIKINEDIAQGIIDEENDGPRNIVRAFQATIADAIKNSTPLPEGHGDLVDRNDLLAESYVIDDYAGNEINIVDRMTVEMVDAIIEADTPKRRKGTPLEENDSGYNCENWIP